MDDATKLKIQQTSVALLAWMKEHPRVDAAIMWFIIGFVVRWIL